MSTAPPPKPVAASFDNLDPLAMLGGSGAPGGMQNRAGAPKKPAAPKPGSGAKPGPSAEAVLADPHRGNSKSALQEWSQGQGLGLPRYACSEVSQRHGDPKRFQASVTLPPDLAADGWGGSRREAEQQAAEALMAQLKASSSGRA